MKGEGQLCCMGLAVCSWRMWGEGPLSGCCAGAPGGLTVAAAQGGGGERWPQGSCPLNLGHADVMWRQVVERRKITENPQQHQPSLGKI